MIKNTMSMSVEPITTECQRTLITQTIPKDGKVGGPTRWTRLRTVWDMCGTIPGSRHQSYIVGPG